MTTQHTPTPWQKTLAQSGYVITTANPFERICGGTHAVNRANADYIVRAVNAHAELYRNMAALCDAVEALLSSEPEMSTYQHDYTMAETELGIAHAALAQARGEK